MDFAKYSCPITKCIFLEPVIASDGHIYEKQAISQWIRTVGQSPLTREEISLDVYPVVYFKNELLSQLKLYSQYNDSVYRYLNSYDPMEIKELIELGNIDAMLKYTDFCLRTNLTVNLKDLIVNKPLAWYIFKYLKSDLLHRHVIKNSTDLFVDTDMGNKKLPIHYIIKYCNQEIVLELLNTYGSNFDRYFELRNLKKMTGLNYLIIHHGTNELIMQNAINRNFILSDNILMKERQNPYHLMFKHCSIKFLEDLLITTIWSIEEVEVIDYNSMTFIHYLFMRQDLSKKIIQTVLTNSILSESLVLKNDDNWSPAHYFIIYSKYDILKKFIRNFQKYIVSIEIDLQIIPDVNPIVYSLHMDHFLKINNYLTDKQRRFLNKKLIKWSKRS
jgi:hypothetical protein